MGKPLLDEDRGVAKERNDVTAIDGLIYVPEGSVSILYSAAAAAHNNQKQQQKPK